MSNTLLQPEDRVLSTLEKDGSRRWLFPRLSRGRFLTRRRVVAYILIAIFTLLPYTSINGKPTILLDVVHRRFTLFGFTFLPTDTVLLALLMLILILSIFFVTAVLGRVWCGWACPQTVYMEFVFRPFERLFLGKSGTGGRPTRPVAAWRYVAMYVTFFLISFYLAHTFLSYFVGVESLRKWVFGSPLEHPAAFLIVVVVTLLMMFDFVFFREQTCIIACPYGRFQGVLLDRSSLIISYDPKRGEPRGKQKADSRERIADSIPAAPRTISLSAIGNPPSARKGDCIDCTMCVQVCPTGIDIRDGLQIECVACAQCIDACDAVMDKIKRPRGLIRYDSQAAMAGAAARLVRPRVVIYGALIVGLLSLLSYLIATKAPTDVTVLRALGRPYVIQDDGTVFNDLRVKITNRTDAPQTYRIDPIAGGGEVTLKPTIESFTLVPGEVRTEPVHVVAPRAGFSGGIRDIEIRVLSDKYPPIAARARLLGPSHAPRPATGEAR
mgnify:CR=1 FL=1